MESKIIRTLTIIFLMSWNCDYQSKQPKDKKVMEGDMETKKVEAPLPIVSDKEKKEIRNLAKKYMALKFDFATKKELREFEASDVRGPGGESLQIYIIKDFDIDEKVEVMKDWDYPFIVKVVIGVNFYAKITGKGFRNIDCEKFNCITGWSLGFFLEDGDWKIVEVNDEVFLTKNGAIKWFNKYKDEHADIYDSVMSELKKLK